MPIPDAHQTAFDRLVDDARALFGGVAVTADVVSPELHRLPRMRLPGLTVLGEQWLLVEADDRSGPSHRWELGWDAAGLSEARALLRQHLARMRHLPGADDALVAAIVAVVGDSGTVTVSTVQAEFDRVVRVVPHRPGAVPFEVCITRDLVVYLTGQHLGWWTFGGAVADDGTDGARAVVEQLVRRGGVVRTARGQTTLLDARGARISGPHPPAVRRLRAQRLHALPYRRASPPE